VNFFYNGTDIYNDVSVNYCVHEMFAEKQADTLVIRFNDTKGVWSKWQPAAGDTVRLKEGASDTGKMFIHSMKPENGLFTIRAMSMPKTGQILKSKSWEGVRFLQLANEFAASHGLDFKNYGCEDQLYPYIKQENESDFALFSRICTLEGCQMLIFDGALLAYNEQYIEGQQPAGSLEIDENGVFTYADNREAMFGSCEVASGSFSGKFVADAANSVVLRPKSIMEASRTVTGLPASKDRQTLQCTSNAEAARFAKGLLRNANKYGRTGQFSKALMTGYAAASLVTLSTTKASMWDGTVFVYKVRHDFVGNKSTVYFRDLLEGY
jgi:hypothetical protein